MDWARFADQFSCKFFFCSFKIERARACNMESVQDRDVVAWFAGQLIDRWSLKLCVWLLADQWIDPRSLYLWNLCKTGTVNAVELII